MACEKCLSENPQDRYNHWGSGVKYCFETMGGGKSNAMGYLRSHLQKTFESRAFIDDVCETIEIRLNQHIEEKRRGHYDDLQAQHRFEAAERAKLRAIANRVGMTMDDQAWYAEQSFKLIHAILEKRFTYSPIAVAQYWENLGYEYPERQRMCVGIAKGWLGFSPTPHNDYEDEEVF